MRLWRPETSDIFEKLCHIFPRDVSVNNYPRAVLAAFNPGALVRGEELWVFPRLIFDYYGYTSSIGVLTLDAEKLLSGELEKPLETRLAL